MGVASSETRDIVAGRRDLLVAGALVVLAFAGSLHLFERRWGRSAMADISAQPGGWAGALLVVAMSAVVHELLHAFGWRVFARLPRRAVQFRVTARVMGFAAVLNAAASARAFRAGTAMPALVLGGGGIAAGIFGDLGLVLLWGLFFLLESYSDLATLLALRRVPPHALVRSHPTRLGCQLVGG